MHTTVPGTATCIRQAKPSPNYTSLVELLILAPHNVARDMLCVFARKLSSFAKPFSACVMVQITER